jgi:hypothetical protein
VLSQLLRPLRLKFSHGEHQKPPCSSVARQPVEPSSDRESPPANSLSEPALRITFRIACPFVIPFDEPQHRFEPSAHSTTLINVSAPGWVHDAQPSVSPLSPSHCPAVSELSGPSQGFTPASMCAHAVASTCRTISPSSSPKAQSKPEFLGFFVIPPLLTKASGVQPGSSKFMSYVRCAPLLNLS